MPLAFVLALAVIGFVWWAWGRQRAGNAVAGKPDQVFRKRDCKWSETGDQNGRFVEYRCATCDIAAYSTTGNAPTTCKRNLRGKS